MRDSKIYKIINTETGSFYIGKSVEIEKRYNAHLNQLNKNKHHNYKIQKDFNNGHELVIIIIETTSTESALEREQFYIDSLDPDYNIAKNTIAPMLGRRHSEHTRKKMGARIHPKGRFHHNFGRKWSPSTREKILSKRIGIKRSDETKSKQRNAAIRRNAYEVLLPFIELKKRQIIDSFGNIFKSLTDTAEFWNISVSTVCDILKGRHSKTRKGVSFRYE